MRLVSSIAQITPTPGPSHQSHLEQPLGHFLPIDMPRAKRMRVLRAEALWRAGAFKVTEIAHRVSLDHTDDIYIWAREYHWPARVDVTETAAAAVRAEVMRRTAASLKPDITERIQAAARPDPVKPPPPGTIDLDAARDAAPLSSPEQVRLGVREAAAADATAELILNEFVSAVAQVAEDHQRTVRELQAWGCELMTDARAVDVETRDHLATLARPSLAEKHKALQLRLANYQKIVTSMNTTIGMGRRVYMLDATRAPGLRDSEESPGNPMPVVPHNPGSYEDYIAQAEREGRDLTPA